MRRKERKDEGGEKRKDVGGEERKDEGGKENIKGRMRGVEEGRQEEREGQ